MKNTANSKLKNWWKISFVLLIVLFLALASIMLVNHQIVYADEISNNPSEEFIENEEADDSTFFATGCIPETPQTKLPEMKISTTGISVFSQNVVDYTDLFPTPGNQGPQNSCVGWAVGYAAKSYLVSIGEKWDVKEYQFSPSYIYNQINGGVDKGSKISDAMHLVVEQGVCLLSDMPYNKEDFTTQPMQNQIELASGYRSLRMGWLEGGNVNAIKYTLQSGIPVVISVPSCPELHDLNESNPIYDTVSDSDELYHAICLIGYDDSKDAFKFINSWGTSWGLDGYGYVAYSLIETFNTTGWVLYDAKFGQFADSQFSGTELTKYVPINDADDSIIIPNGITRIGDGALENQNIVTEISLPDTVTSIGDRAFKNCYNMNSINLPNAVTSIGDEVFSGCSSLSTISPLNYIKTIADKAFMDCTSLENITIPTGLTYVGNGAFAGCNNLNLSVSAYNPNYSAQENILYNKARTKIIASGKIVPHIEVFNNITEIAPYSFAKNNNLIALSISSVSKIGEYAFYNCSSLKTVYYNSYTLPVLGENSFPNNNFALYVPFIKQDVYRSLFADYTNNVLSKEVNLYFISEGSTIGIKKAYQGEYINEYLFTPTKEGYTFEGWYKNAELTGEPYQSNDLINSDTTLSLYAKWEPQKYQITLDPNGGIITGDNNFNVEYGASFNIEATVSREGYTFEGWYDSSNVMYANSDGLGMTSWDQTANTTLYAHWAIKSYEIQINNDGTITWLGPTGLSSEQCTIPYGTSLEAINLVPMFKESEQGFKEGHIFDHFKYNNETVNWTKIPDFGENGAVITIIPVWVKEQHIIYFNTLCEITVKELVKDFGTEIVLPSLTRRGYTFKGWFSDAYSGYQIRWTRMPDLTPSTQNNGSTMIYARWDANQYTVSYYPNGGEGTMSPTSHTVDISKNLSPNAFTKNGYKFIGWATSPNGSVNWTDAQSVLNLSYQQGDGVKLYAVWEVEVYKINYVYNGAGHVSNPTTYTIESDTIVLRDPLGTPKTGYKYVWNKSVITKGSTGDLTISSVVTPIVYRVIYSNVAGPGYPSIPWYDIEYDQEFTFYQAFEPEEGYVLDCWTLVNNQTNVKTNLGSGETCTIKNLTTIDGESFTLTAEYKEETCVAEGTLITLADGTQKAVEQLTGDEMLLVWNLYTGTFDVAPILFIDSDPANMYEVINLYFSDGTSVKVIYEHAFWDIDLNQYVFLRNDAAQYIGHWFNKQTTDANGQIAWTKVQLTDVVVKDEYTTSWSPVTFSHLCYYVNGMLSMPGATEGLINIFDVDADTMSYDQTAFEADIEKYGLFTYEEFAEILPVSQEVFEAFNGQYLKVSIGKGLITMDDLYRLVERYKEFF